MTNPERNAEKYRRWNVPRLPLSHLSRTDQLHALLAQLEQQAKGMTAIVGLQGMGGIGKTVLATELARSAEIESLYPDGVYWLTIGREPELVNRQRELAYALSGENQTFTDAAEGRGRLRELLADRHCLIFLDDVWETQHLRQFDILEGSGSSLLVTTRKQELVKPFRGQEFELNLLPQAEALAMLAESVGLPEGDVEASDDAREVVKACGRLPLALGMIGAMVQGRDNPWAYAIHRLASRDLGRIAHEFPGYPYPSLWAAIDVSVAELANKPAFESLDPIERYLDLSIFPEDESIPAAPLERLWAAEGLSTFDTQDLLRLFVQQAVVQSDEDGSLRLHDLQYDYLQVRCQTTLRERHERMVSAYERENQGIWSNGPDDGYYFQNLFFHLHEAGRQEFLEDLLLNYAWLKSKLGATNAICLLQDFDWCSGIARQAPRGLLREALRLSQHILSRDAKQLAGQLLGRLLKTRSIELWNMLSLALLDSDALLQPLKGSLIAPGGPLLFTLSNHADGVGNLLLHPDGKWLITSCPESSSDYTVRIWDLDSGEVVHTLDGHDAGVANILLHSDGRRLITSCCSTRYSSGDHTVRVWDLDSGEVVHTLAGHEDGVNNLLLHPDGQRLITSCSGTNFRSGDHTIRVWDLDSGEVMHILTGHEDGVDNVLLHPDGQRLITSCCGKGIVSKDHTVRVWGLDSGKALHILTGHEDGVNNLLLHPDGQRLITSCGDTTSRPKDHTVRVWDLDLGEVRHTLFGHLANVTNLLLHPNGQWLITSCRGGGDHTVRVWDLDSGKTLHTFTGHEDGVDNLLLHLDGRRLITSCSDNTFRKSDHTVRIWDLDSGKVLHNLSAHADSISNFLLHPNGKWLITFYSGPPFINGDHTVRVWDLDSGEVSHILISRVDGVANILLHPDDQRLIISCHGTGSNDHSVKVVDIHTGEIFHYLTGHTDTAINLLLHPDGKRLITSCSGFGNSGTGTSSNDHTVIVWDLDLDEACYTTTDHVDGVDNLLLHPDGKRLITSCHSIHDHTVRVWNLDSGEVLRTLVGHADGVDNLLLHLDGQRLITSCRSTISSDYTVRIWNLDSGEVLHILTGHQANVGNLVLHPDGKRLITSCSGRSNDHTVKVWDLDSGEALCTFIGHVDGVENLLLHPDGQRLITSCPNITSGDCTARIWDLNSGVELHVFTGHDEGVENLLLHPDGQRLITSCGRSSSDHTIRVWDLNSGEAIHTYIGHVAGVDNLLVHPDGQRLITSCSGNNDHVVRIWDLDSGESLKVLVGHDHGVSEFLLHPDGQQLITSCRGTRVRGTGSRDQTVKVWNLDLGEEIHTLTGHNDGVANLLLHPDGQRLITSCCGISRSSYDHTVRIWDLVTGNLLLAFPHGQQRTQVWHNDGYLIGGDDFQQAIWDLTSGQKLAEFTTDGQILEMLTVGNEMIVLGDSLGHIHFLKTVAH